jgi:collagen type VI alpha
VFVLDSSGSLGRDHFYHVLNFTYNIVDELDIDNGNYRVGVVTFSDSARLEFYLDRYSNKVDLEKAISRINYVYGSTHTADALRMTREEVLSQSTGDRPGIFYELQSNLTMQSPVLKGHLFLVLS